MGHSSLSFAVTPADPVPETGESTLTVWLSSTKSAIITRISSAS
jgi:hypothetical protein